MHLPILGELRTGRMRRSPPCRWCGAQVPHMNLSFASELHSMQMYLPAPPRPHSAQSRSTRSFLMATSTGLSMPDTGHCETTLMSRYVDRCGTRSYVYSQMSPAPSTSSTV